MKHKLLFTVVVLLTGLHVKGQDPSAIMFGNDMEWIFYGSDSNSDREWFHEFYRIEGSVEKNGKTYHVLKILRAFLDSGSGSAPEGYQDHDAVGSLCVRTEGGRVFVNREEYMKLISDDSYWRWVGNRDYIPYPQTSDGELILYDFNMQAGDQFVASEGHENVYVADVKSIVTEDKLTRRLLILSNGYQIVEGIGCVNSPGMWLFYLNPGLAPYNDSYLSFYGYHPEGTSTFETFYRGARGGLTDIRGTVQDSRPVSQDDLFDLQGRCLTTQPTKGLYIRNGKKYIVK
ncbi:MAG: hypothetical protein II404_05015 [Prevotella sp.]|nr:hypothetical protein [Prevotella sp.]